MPAEMQGGGKPGATTSNSAAEAKKNDTVSADDDPGTVVQGEQKAGGGGGLREIQGIVDGMSALRKRKGAKGQAGEKAAADCPKGDKEEGVGARTEKIAPSGEWREWHALWYLRTVRTK